MKNIEAWRAFARSHRAIAVVIENLILAACELIKAEPDIKKKIALFQSSPVCRELKGLLEEHADELRIEDRSDTSYMEWALRVCAHSILQEAQAR